MLKKLIAVLLVLCMLPVIPVFAETVTSQRISTSDSGFSVVGNWANSTMADSTGSTANGVSKYSGTVGNYAQYQPSNLKPGWYDVSFWNIKYQTNQNPMKMTGTVYSNGEFTENITLPVNTESADRGGIWSKVGTYYFAGTNDEYFRFVVAIGGAQSRVADVKFELNENYQAPKVTYQRIGTTDTGFSTSGRWVDATMADSTGSTTSGVSIYTATVGNYAQYTPTDLKPGWYDVSFWNIKYQDHQNPIKMTGTVYSNGVTTENIVLPVNAESADRGGIWSKVGTYYFAGTNDEYFRLVVAISGDMSRAADVKFELNENYVPPRATSQLITTVDSGFSKAGNWANASMGNSLGNTTSGASLYSNLKGDYTQYMPNNLEPGWYDVSFWNIKYQDSQNPIKMSGTLYANGITKTDIILPVNTESADRGGIWSKVGTYYFAGTDDEYFRLVATGGSHARPSDVKFEKNDSYTPPPSFGDSEICVTEDDGFAAIATEGIYNVYINKSDGATDGRIDLCVDGVVIDSKYTNYIETGREFLGSYRFEKGEDVTLKYIAFTGEESSPVNAVYFAPPGDMSVVYNLYNMQKNGEKNFFFTAGVHKITADVINNSTTDKNFQLVVSVTGVEDFVSRPAGEIIKYNALNKVVLSDRILVESGKTAELSVEIPIENAGADTKLKAYIWDGVQNMIPVFPAKAYQPKDTRIINGVTLTPDCFDDGGTWTRLTNTDAFTDVVLMGATSSSVETRPAAATVDLIEGTYRVWVRSLNFSIDPHSRYFNVSVNGNTLSKTFGQVGTDGFVWEDGGTVELNGKTVISLIDTSKHYAKIDSIVLTRDLEYIPETVFAQVTGNAPLPVKNSMNLTLSEMMIDFAMDKDFPGGNYILNNKEKNTVYISPDMSDTSTDWFYWNFKATSDTARTVTFNITGCDQVISASGAVYSEDEGKTWNYITESAKKNEFTYSFEAGKTVWFAVTIPYQLSDLTEHLNTLSKNERAAITTLCKSEEGRGVPLVTIGNTNAEKAVLFTGRHHCCETTTSFVLEGVMDYLCTNMPEEFFDTYCVYIVPMVDIDGVENGDQGKARIPHDHNRDYEADRYNVTKAIKALAETIDVEFFLDYHCPYLQTSKPYLYYSTEDADVIAAFSDILTAQTAASEAENPIIFDGASNNNDGDHYNACSRGYFYNVEGSPFSTTLEFPYSGVVGDEYTIERMYNFGIDVMKAVQTYLTTK